MKNVFDRFVTKWSTDETLNIEQRCSWISREVVEFLNELFADRVFILAIDKGAGSGGWKLPFRRRNSRGCSFGS
jgi:hypothetical protein